MSRRKKSSFVILSKKTTSKASPTIAFCEVKTIAKRINEILLKIDIMTKQKADRSIQRDPQEVIDVFNYNISMLEHLCEEFDRGRTEAALWIAVVLRTLLHTSSNQNKDKKKNTNKLESIAIIEQLKVIDSKYDFDFLSTSFPCPEGQTFAQGWQIGNGVCGVNVALASVYAGLIIKTINRADEEGYVADTMIKCSQFEQTHRMLPLKEWMNEKVFLDKVGGNSLTRWGVISMLANKDGGAHFDPKVPVKYDTFRHPNLFKVSFGSIEVPFSRNPVYVSVRQIAWEVLESLKRR